MACKRSAVRSRLSPPQNCFTSVADEKSPSSRGLGHRPFTAVTRVRISLGTPKMQKPPTGWLLHFCVAQLVRTRPSSTKRGPEDLAWTRAARSRSDGGIALRRGRHNLAGVSPFAPDGAMAPSSNCQPLSIVKRITVAAASCRQSVICLRRINNASQAITPLGAQENNNKRYRPRQKRRGLFALGPRNFGGGARDPVKWRFRHSHFPAPARHVTRPPPASASCTGPRS